MCLGNICRSPTAEAVFTDVVQKAGRAGVAPCRHCVLAPEFTQAGSVRGFNQLPPCLRETRTELSQA